MDDTVIDGLLYKSEGTDLDFKSTQYRFVKGSDADKAELLKDVLAIANAWRDGTGFILIGFKDQRPHAAAVVGISEHLDDASVQQFINGKVKPKLHFHYEEQLYEGKTVGVIAIPKQPRPFYLSHPYGALKSNVVYVRRGSSTDEAEPPEVAKMMATDAGRGNASVQLSVLNLENEPAPDSVVVRFLSFSSLPDYARDRGPFEPSVWHDNRDYWREVAAYLQVRESLVALQFELSNRSEFALSNAKLEVAVEGIDGHSFKIMAGEDLPDEPQRQWSPMMSSPHFAHKAATFEIDDDGRIPRCHVRFGTLLPGETSRSSDHLAVLPAGPCKLVIRFRILASELASPIESERVLDVAGVSEEHDFDGLENILYGD